MQTTGIVNSKQNPALQRRPDEAVQRQPASGDATHGRGASDGEASPIADLTSDDDAAVENFVRTHIPSMTAIAESLLGDQASAEDCVQEAFFKLSRTPSGVEEFPNLKAWLHHTVVSQALMRLRVMHERNGASNDGDHPSFGAKYDSVEQSWRQLTAPIEIDQSTDNGLTVLSSINQLPETDRLLLQLHDVRELTKPEVAKKLGLSEVEVRTRLPNARLKLMRLLEPALRGEL